MHELLRCCPNAALALDRLDKDRRGFFIDRVLDRADIAEGDLIEARRFRPEALDVFLLSAGGDRRERAAVESTFEGDDVELLDVPLGEMIAPRRLDRTFERFRTRIGEEHPIGEGHLGQPPRKAFLPRNLVEIGQMPDLVGLRLQRLDEMRMGMAERVHGDTGSEIEIARAVFGDQPNAFTSLETQRRAQIGVVKRRGCGHVELSFIPAASDRSAR